MQTFGVHYVVHYVTPFAIFNMLHCIIPGDLKQLRCEFLCLGKKMHVFREVFVEFAAHQPQMIPWIEEDKYLHFYAMCLCQD